MQWDYIIIGAGSAGCAAAYHLVETGKNILLIEAGGDDRKSDVKHPFKMLQAQAKYDWGYISNPDNSRRGRRERWHRGKILGGTSSVNGMIYVRGSHADFDRWAAVSDESWSSSSVMPLFHEIERCDHDSIKTSPETRGYLGQLHVRKVQRPHLTSRAFVKALVEMGYPYNEDYNAESQEGVGYSQLTQYKGRRFNTFEAFVRPRIQAGNLEILSECTVRGIDISDGRAVGVVIERDGVTTRIPAANIILSAGVTNSPKILMLSGIGDGAELSRLGIDVKLDRPAVGRGLMDHPYVRLVYDMRVPTYALGRNPFRAAGALAKYLLWGQGLLASPHEAMAFVRSSPERAEPNLQLHFAPIGVPMGKGDKPPQLMNTPSVFISIKNNYPESRGSVRLQSADPLEAPEIDANLLGDPADIEGILGGIEIVRRAMRSHAMEPLVKSELSDSAGCRTYDELRDYVVANAITAAHPIGTCRMGRDADAVVDADLRVRGVSNLWIADASIMPHHISGNTNAASIMIGYKLGKALAGSR